MISYEKKMQFIQLRAMGESFDKISQSIGVSKPTLIKLAREFADEIEEMEEVFMKELLGCHRLSIMKQMELARRRLDTIQHQLDDRKLAVMGSRELASLEIKYLKYVNQLVEPYMSRRREEKKEKKKKLGKESTAQENSDSAMLGGV